MSNKRMDDREILKIIQKIARDAIEMTQGETRESLDTDHKFSLAVTQLLKMMGDAASDVSATTQAELPQIKWSKMREMRDQIVHVYYDIDLDAVWDTITKDLQPLVDELEKVL